MAAKTSIGGDGKLFAGGDKTLRFEVLDAAGVPVDVAGWTLVFDVRARDDAPSPALLSKTPTVTGTYNAVRSVNTQRILVTLLAADTAALGAGVFRHALARLDPGSKDPVAWGNLILQKATQP